MSWQWRLLQRHFDRVGPKPPRPTVESADLRLIHDLLRSDLAAAFSAHQRGHEIVRAELCPLNDALSNTPCLIGLTYPQASLHSSAAQALIDCAVEVTSEAGQTASTSPHVVRCAAT